MFRLLRLIESAVYGVVLILASQLPDADEPADDPLASPL
jgi:hypothetical protein